jgi:hypothetical protein
MIKSGTTTPFATPNLSLYLSEVFRIGQHLLQGGPAYYSVPPHEHPMELGREWDAGRARDDAEDSGIGLWEPEWLRYLPIGEVGAADIFERGILRELSMGHLKPGGVQFLIVVDQPNQTT